MSDQNLEGQFEKKGIILAVLPSNVENIEEVCVDHAIEAGAEEVSTPDDNENELLFSCDALQLHKVRSKLQELKYNVKDSKITFIPKIKVNLGDDELELMDKIISKIEELPEVVEIHDNIA